MCLDLKTARSRRMSTPDLLNRLLDSSHPHRRVTHDEAEALLTQLNYQRVIPDDDFVRGETSVWKHPNYPEREDWIKLRKGTKPGTNWMWTGTIEDMVSALRKAHLSGGFDVKGTGPKASG
jgi:hypothetical protein